MTAGIANNVILGSILIIVACVLNMVGIVLLVMAARTNLRTARMLLEVSNYRDRQMGSEKKPY